jgi:4-hydroxy-2-oxoheptanedioate aldolase
MNRIEREMVEVLDNLKQNHHVIGVKAEFEAEGTRLEEAMRLKEVISAAGLGLTLKIGGCEAIRDMYEARVLGVSRIVAPMVETPYALKKYLGAVKLAFPADERDQVKFVINVETVTAVKNLDDMLALPEIEGLDGIVIGRVDMSGSAGLGRDDINSDRIFDITKEVVVKCHARGMDTAVGGGVSADALPFLRNLPDGSINYYETRKVIFECPQALHGGAEKGILTAVYFELLWLKNKREFYGMIFDEDAHRIQMLEARYKSAMEKYGIAK